MCEIKCLENYKNLKIMLEHGEKGDADYFSKRLGISKRSFFRLLKYLQEIDNMDVNYNKCTGIYSVD